MSGSSKPRWRSLRKAGLGGAFLIVVVLLLMWLAGAFHRKVEDSPTRPGAPITAGRPVGNTMLVPARLVSIPRTETSSGTIHAVHQTTVASKLLAKVIEVNVTAGQRVAQEEILVRLDDADLRARLEQAQSAAVAARAQRDQALIEHDRVAKLQERDAASKIEWDRVQAALKSAEAELAGDEQAVKEAQTVLDYATIRAPIQGVVIEKKVEVGDMVTPGQPLLSFYDPTRMQLVASVRESLTQRLAVGQTVDVEIDALHKRCQGRISEIVPEAEAASRTFAVKVTGPCPAGIYTGMFGRLLVPLEDQQVLLIPQTTVHRVGQLDMVDVAEGSTLVRRAVTLGRTFEDDVEVLSGLRNGERVAVPSDAKKGS